MRFLRSPPAAHSSTMKSTSSSRNESEYLMMFGCAKLRSNPTSLRHLLYDVLLPACAAESVIRFTAHAVLVAFSRE